MRDNERQANVIELPYDCPKRNIRQRKDLCREILAAKSVMSDDTAPVSMLIVLMSDEAQMKTCALTIDPDQVDLFVAEIDRIKTRLLEYKRENKAEVKSIQVA